MKKSYLWIALCLILLTGCFSSKTGLVHVEAEDAVTAIENKDTMILLVGKKTCGACAEFQKVIDEFVGNYDVRITEVYLDEEKPVVDEETQEESYPNNEKLEQYVGVVGATPTVFFIEDGVIKGTFTGSVSYDTFKSKVEKYGFLPEQ